MQTYKQTELDTQEGSRLLSPPLGLVHPLVVARHDARLCSARNYKSNPTQRLTGNSGCLSVGFGRRGLAADNTGHSHRDDNKCINNEGHHDQGEIPAPDEGNDEGRHDGAQELQKCSQPVRYANLQRGGRRGYGGRGSAGGHAVDGLYGLGEEGLEVVQTDL